MCSVLLVIAVSLWPGAAWRQTDTTPLHGETTMKPYLQHTLYLLLCSVDTSKSLSGRCGPLADLLLLLSVSISFVICKSLDWVEVSEIAVLDSCGFVSVKRIIVSVLSLSVQWFVGNHFISSNTFQPNPVFLFNVLKDGFSFFLLTLYIYIIFFLR